MTIQIGDKSEKNLNEFSVLQNLPPPLNFIQALRSTMIIQEILIKWNITMATSTHAPPKI